MAHKLEALCVLLSLSISLASCGPTQAKSQASSPAPPSSLTQSATKPAPATTNAPKNTASQLSSAASVASGSPSLVSLRPGVEARPSAADSAGPDMDAFDGKNPFADDSLWQIPVHLTRDLNSVNEDRLAKSASEPSPAADYGNSNSNNHNDDDGDIESLDEPEAPNAAGYTQSSSSSPTIISASTDLKTAAGYHYPSHGNHGYHGHGGSPSYGSHHGGEHYGGKYFQYASVPYPYAWDFGYKRGNPYHTIERYEHGKGPHFQTKVKWSDKYGGYGVHVWDYNHDDHHSHHYKGDEHHDGYESHAPSHYGGGHHAGSAHYGASHH